MYATCLTPKPKKSSTLEGQTAMAEETESVTKHDRNSFPWPCGPAEASAKPVRTGGDV